MQHVPLAEQLSLDEWPCGTRPARARRTDPDSSHAAADRAEKSGGIGAQALATFVAVRAYPGLTSKQLAETCPLDRYQIARRLPELERRGLIRRASTPDEEERWFPR